MILRPTGPPRRAAAVAVPGDRLQSFPGVQPGAVVRAVEARRLPRGRLVPLWPFDGPRSDDHSQRTVGARHVLDVRDRLARVDRYDVRSRPGLLDVRPGFAPHEANGDSTIVAFKNAPAGALHAITIYRQASAYGMAVLDGYASELPADAHEDDNSCNAADLQGTLTSPFRDTLTIENPHDIDWIRFTVSSLGTYESRLDTLPGPPRDTLRDLDLYVVRVPTAGDASLQVVLAD